MNTLEKLKYKAEIAIDKIKKCQGSKEDLKIVQIYLSLFSKKSGRAGKRKIIKTG